MKQPRLRFTIANTAWDTLRHSAQQQEGRGIGEGSCNLCYPGGTKMVYTFNLPFGETRCMEISTTRTKERCKMSTTYKAIQVTRPGALNLVQRLLPEPGPGQARLRVEACGVCHSDSATVDGSFPGISYPRVPGHDVVGRIDALGSGVQGWAVGQRVGVGFLAGSCGYC